MQYKTPLYSCSRAALTALLIAVPTAGQAQANPTKPVRFIVASAPGGGSDLLGRVVGQALSDLWQKPVVIDNRAGGGGSIATEIAVKSTPDGSTLLLASFGVSYIGALRKNLPYDVTRDLSPLVSIASQPSLLVVHNAVPVNSLAELIQLAKAKPAQLNYGTSGAGGASHLGTELFASAAQIRLTPVNYKGTGFATSALVSGEVQMALVGTSTAIGHVKAKRLKALGTTGAKRSPLVPDIPAVAETLPGFEFDVWYAIFGPSGMPQDRRHTINADVNRVLQQPVVRERIVAVGAEPGGGSEQAFVKFFRAEVVKWHKVIRDADIRPD